MCLICIDLDRNTLRAAEARRALGEMRPGLAEGHIRAVEAKITDALRREAEVRPSTPPDVTSGT